MTSANIPQPVVVAFIKVVKNRYMLGLQHRLIQEFPLHMQAFHGQVYFLYNGCPTSGGTCVGNITTQVLPKHYQG
ncbi:MAG: hypothetical protein IPI23_03000 [Bacteroidetes bacterium]|nr:hypothetical protein [Bacteroidota bacterium]